MLYKPYAHFSLPMLPVPYFATLPQSLNLWIQNRGHHGISLVHVDVEIYPTQPCILARQQPWFKSNNPLFGAISSCWSGTTLAKTLNLYPMYHVWTKAGLGNIRAKDGHGQVCTCMHLNYSCFLTPVVTYIYLAHVWTLHGVSDHEGHRKLSARTRYDMSGEKTSSLPLLGFITVNLYSWKIGLQIEMDVF